MGFMFLPTLGVLLMLTVGFFDPIAMWNWIKSDDGWAIFTRIVLFLAEIVLVTVLYFYYLQEDRAKDIISNAAKNSTKGTKVYYGTDIYQIFDNASSNRDHYVCTTEDDDIKIIRRV